MCSNERKLEWKWVTVMNPFDPYHHQRTEYWADKVMEQSRTGYSTGHLRAADALWHIMETTVKIRDVSHMVANFVVEQAQEEEEPAARPLHD